MPDRVWIDRDPGDEHVERVPVRYSSLSTTAGEIIGGGLAAAFGAPVEENPVYRAFLEWAR